MLRVCSFLLILAATSSPALAEIKLASNNWDKIPDEWRRAGTWICKPESAHFVRYSKGMPTGFSENYEKFDQTTEISTMESTIWTYDATDVQTLDQIQSASYFERTGLISFILKYGDVYAVNYLEFKTGIYVSTFVFPSDEVSIFYKRCRPQS